MEKILENEKQIISYLFGEMAGAERDEFEEKLFLDEDFSLFVSGVENDLIDDYIRGELEAGEKLKFERAFLTTETGREKVRAAQILRAKLFDEKQEKAILTAETKVPFRHALADLFRAPNLALASGLAAILLFLLGGIWLFNRPPTEIVVVDNKNQPAITPVQSLSPQNSALVENKSKTNQSSEDGKNTPDNTNVPQNNQSNKREIAPAKPGANEPEKNQKPPTAAPQRVFAFSLLPPLRSSERPVLKIPPGARTVRLQLFDNFGEKYEKYSAELTGSGNSLWNWEIAAAKKRPQKSITVNIPGNRLKADSYELVVRGVIADGSVEEISFYNFVVQRK